MRELFETIRRRLSSGDSLAMVTVVASSGATPRGAGARMLVDSTGRIQGTIGGGAVEYQAQQAAIQVLEAGASREELFLLRENDGRDLGMICGGEVQVYIHYLPARDSGILETAALAEALYAQGRDLWLMAELTSGGRIGVCGADGIIPGLGDFRDVLAPHPARITREGREYYLEQIGDSGKVYLFGCGHVAQELVPLLTHIGFRCIALDDRPEFANRTLFPTAEQVLPVDFENIAATVSITEKDYICVMTRGHSYDTVVQAQLLRTPARYIGVIGSRRKKEIVFRRLREEFGCTDAQLLRITTPIGLDIGAETPAEIAVSIAAQMIQHRAGSFRGSPSGGAVTAGD